MASTAISAQGCTLEIDVAAAGTPDTEIANLFSFSGLDGEASEIDVTSLSSTAKEYKLGLKDYGNFSIEYHVDFDDAGQDDLRSAGVSGDVKTFRLTLPNGRTLTFSALVKNADSISGGVDATVNGGASLRITGAVTVA
ncbi:phage tail tube protein [Paraglaciecola sp.]|uniref:phage tail tube protein n=1 Tax=Paraglaciecola sp. TaxID=1920173 RepID=UPI003EF56DD6